MKKLLVVFMLIMVIGISGCNNGGLFGDCDDCNDAIEEAMAAYPNTFADCSSTEWSDGDWCYDCWWWEQGVNHTFCQWDACGCDITSYYFSPIYASIFPVQPDVEDPLSHYVIYKDDDIEVRFGKIKLYKESLVIPFAASKHLEDPIVSVMTDNGLDDCYVEFTLHESGRTTGIIHLPYPGVTMIYFNNFEIEYKF